jgi:hypothetical protein
MEDHWSTSCFLADLISSYNISRYITILGLVIEYRCHSISLSSKYVIFTFLFCPRPSPLQKIFFISILIHTVKPEYFWWHLLFGRCFTKILYIRILCEIIYFIPVLYLNQLSMKLNYSCMSPVRLSVWHTNAILRAMWGTNKQASRLCKTEIG